MSELSLKMIALFAMILDHLAAIGLCSWLPEHPLIDYNLWRSIGRISFPIFAFCITQGYKFTSSYKQYVKRLFFVGVISQIPYTLTLNSGYIKQWDWENLLRAISHLNILYTLLLGLIILFYVHENIFESYFHSTKATMILAAASSIAIAISFLYETAIGTFQANDIISIRGIISNQYLLEKLGKYTTVVFLNLILILLTVQDKHSLLKAKIFKITTVLICFFLLEDTVFQVISIDYGLSGLLLILALSFAQKPWHYSGIIFFWGLISYHTNLQKIIWICIISVIFLLYNGKRSNRSHKFMLKMFYYFYPLHLCALWIIMQMIRSVFL